ncbi:MAG TPA: fasciclin domain-containing protein [candidate division Zixibacteria bacterium]|nr:fasciclin domain-containing protein [candidate division Zixibacteria bacterium]
MKRMTRSIFVAIIALMVAVPFVGAAGHKTIVEIAVEDGRFDTLVAAVVATDLADALSGGEWTVFAPTDDAFAKLGLNPNNVASAFTKAELTDILLYHALSGEVYSDKAKTLVGDVVMANGQKAGLKVFDDSIFVNDDSKVIIPDISASNGVVHVVDTVILGPWPKTDESSPAIGGSADSAAGNSIVDIAVNDGRFNTLVAAVVYTGLADALSGGEWTVFAPTDDAFAKLGLDANNITGAFSKAELTDILLYHALSGEVKSDKALTLLGDVTMANGQIAGLKAFDGSLYVNDDSKVIIADVIADNGVIHVVDTVILGPWPRTSE